ncbi:unnamed protein product, partial [Rotaria sp. Silwood1]
MVLSVKLQLFQNKNPDVVANDHAVSAVSSHIASIGLTVDINISRLEHDTNILPHHFLIITLEMTF